MSKKRTKSPLISNSNNNNNKWESNIINGELTESGWSYSLSFLVEDVIEDKETVDYILKGLLTGLRRKFSLLSFESVMQAIIEYGNPKAKKNKDVPVNFEVCECAKTYLDHGERIPSTVLAKVIKWMMLSAKANDTKSKDDSVKKSDNKGAKSKKVNDKVETSKSAAGKKGSQATGKRSPEPASVKGDTKLRKRGDPDPDIKFIDDEPDDGSSRYFVVTGIPDSAVIEALAEIGSIVTSVVKITRDIHIPSEEEEETEEVRNKSPSHSQQSEDLETEKVKQAEILKQFWKDIPKILNNNKALLNTPIVTLVAKHLMFPINKDDLEQQEKCSMDLYESVAVSMYDLLDLKRQWQNYLEKSKIIDLPLKISEEVKSEVGVVESAREGKVPNEDVPDKIESRTNVTFESVDMEYYSFLMEDVPFEESSIYLQMSAMLDQVEVTIGEKSVDWNKPKLSTESDLSEEAAEMLNEMIDNLYIPKEELKELRKNLQIKSVTKFDKINQRKEVPIHELDGISLRSNEIHSTALGKEGSMIRELRMLIKSFQNMDLLNVISVEDSVRVKRFARLQEFLKYIENTGLSKIEIDYAIKLFILENLVLSGTDENGIMRVNDQDGVFPKNINQMWDDPFMILEDVSQSIIEEENKIKEAKVNIFEDHSETMREDSSMSEKYSTRSMEGILKRSRSPKHSLAGNTSSRRKSSVHFLELENNEFPGIVTEGELDVTGMLVHEQDEPLQTILLDYLQNVRKRSFTEWCFEEFYEPHVMLQIIQQAFYKLPFMDIYSQRYSEEKIVILHNPFKEKVRYNHQPWNQWLHANVGFRNYLDFINDKIKDWTRDEEAIYQAFLLNKELEINEKSKPEETPKEIPKKAVEKGKKGKVSQSRSRSVSRSSSAESTSQEIILVLPGSLKAQKMERDKILKAKEDEERKKEEKRTLSAQKKLDKDALKDKPKLPSSKSSNKSKSKKSVIEDIQDQIQLTLEEPLDELEEYFPFVGYDLGDDLAHFSGEVAHLFPSDGCTIRVHRTQKLLDSTSVRVSIITAQAHVFSLHILDPSFDTEEEVDNFQKVLDTYQNKSSISRYGSSTCVFNDGISLAASNYGYSGTSEKKNVIYGKEQFPDLSENNSHRSDKNNEEIKGNSLHDETLIETSRTPKSGRNISRDNVDIRDVQNIIMTSPNGVQIRIGYEIDEQGQERSLLLSLTKNEPQSLKLAKKTKFEVVKELGRYVTSDGRVISILNNDSLKVMFADGTVATASLQMETTVIQEVDSEETKMEKITARETPNQKKKKQSKIPATDQTISAEVNVEEPKSVINKTRTWTITRPNGEVYESKANLNMLELSPSLSNTSSKEIIEETNNSSEEQSLNKNQEIPSWKQYIQSPLQKDSLFISCATDPATGETLVTRSDGTLLLTTQDSGIFLSEHSDQTRFTKYFIIEKVPQSKYNEEENAETTKVTEIIQIESKDYPLITIDRTNGKIETRCGSMGSLLSVADGSHFYKHSDGTEIEYRPDGEMIFTAAGNSQMSYLQPYGSSSYVLNTMSKIICEMLDSDGTEFIVDASGSYEVKRCEKVESMSEGNDEGFLKPTSAISGTSVIENNNEENAVRKFDQHAPRIFFLNPDGSGSELLRYRDIVDTIVNSEVDENYFQYKESVQDHPHIIGHTIMNFVKKPKSWKYNYARNTIIPKGLTCRDLKTFPMKEEVKKGPVFAMNIGKGLSIKSNPIDSELSKPLHSKETKDKDCLQFRQFYHYPLITDEVRNSFTKELIEYNKNILRQRQKYKDLEVLDDRSEEEKIMAEEIRVKYKENLRKINGQVLNNAIQALSEAVLSPKVVQTCESNSEKSSKSNGKKLEILLEKERIEKEKELENKEFLRNKFVPNYFTSIYGKDFLTNQAMDLKTLNETMKLFPPSREPTTQADNTIVKEIEQMESSVYSSNEEFQKYPKSAATISDSNLDVIHSKKVEKPTIVFKKKEKQYLYYDSSLIIPNIPKRTPVSSNLPLPRYLYSERPSVEQNIKQAMVEDPVRRKQFTTSLIGGPAIGQVFQRQCRGLNMLPSRLDAGLLKEGGRYTFKIKIINTGPESGFFKIKQPPSSSGIWAEFLPGPIAAGLSREITVHIYAIAKSIVQNDSRVYVIDEALRIITNTDILELPITGRVMTAVNFDLINPSKRIIDIESLPAIRSENNSLITSQE